MSPTIWANQVPVNHNIKYVLVTLAKQSDEYGRAYNVNINALSQECGLDCFTLNNAISKLASLNVITADMPDKFIYLRVNVPPQTFKTNRGDYEH